MYPSNYHKVWRLKMKLSLKKKKKKKKNLFELLKTKIIPYRAAIGG